VSLNGQEIIEYITNIVTQMPIPTILYVDSSFRTWVILQNLMSNKKQDFNFSDAGWLMLKKHSDVRRFGKRVDMSDLEADEWIMFQHRHYLPIALFSSIVLPTLLIYYCCHESLIVSITFGVLFRYVVSLHLTWLINSLAHMVGMKPFDK
jgi:stearoyl-CoA desaturase (Delta-9 desaturase)